MLKRRLQPSAQLSVPENLKFQSLKKTKLGLPKYASKNAEHFFKKSESQVQGFCSFGPRSLHVQD